MANSDKKTADEEVTKGGTDVGGDGTGGSVNTNDSSAGADGPTDDTSKPKDGQGGFTIGKSPIGGKDRLG